MLVVKTGIEVLRQKSKVKDRPTFVPGGGVVCVIDSTELRGIVSEGGARSLGLQDGACGGGGGPGGGLMVALDRKNEADAVD